MFENTPISNKAINNRTLPLEAPVQGANSPNVFAHFKLPLLDPYPGMRPMARADVGTSMRGSDAGRNLSHKQARWVQASARSCPPPPSHTKGLQPELGGGPLSPV